MVGEVLAARGRVTFHVIKSRDVHTRSLNGILFMVQCTINQQKLAHDGSSDLIVPVARHRPSHKAVAASPSSSSYQGGRAAGHDGETNKIDGGPSHTVTTNSTY